MPESFILKTDQLLLVTPASDQLLVLFAAQRDTVHCVPDGLCVTTVTVHAGGAPNSHEPLGQRRRLLHREVSVGPV